VSFIFANIATSLKNAKHASYLILLVEEKPMLPETLSEKSTPRTTMVGFRATLDDRDILHKAARDRGFSTISEFLRDAARNSLKKTR